MAAIDIYIDCDRNVTVTSPTDSSTKQLPKFVQGDTLSLRIWLLKGWNQTSEYEQIPTTGITLAVALGVYPAEGNEDPPTYYTQQFTWTESEDLAQPYFAGTLSFNTEAITTLLGASDVKSATLHIYRTDEGYPNTVLLQRVFIYASTIKEGGITTPADPTPMSVEVGNATYIPFAGHQGTIRLISPNGLYAVDLYCDDNGDFKTDKVTL